MCITGYKVFNNLISKELASTGTVNIHLMGGGVHVAVGYYNEEDLRKQTILTDPQGAVVTVAQMGMSRQQVS